MRQRSEPAGPVTPTRDFEAFRAAVDKARAGLPKRLAQAVRYALAHPDEFALGTAAELAKSAGVQPSTLVRLAHHFGYAGFSDLQSVFRDRLRVRAATYEERLRRLEARFGGMVGESALVRGFLDAARSSIDALAADLDDGRLGQAVDILARAETIYLVATRRAFPLIAHMAYLFGTLGLRAQIVSTANGIEREIAALATRRDAAVACSFAPYARETIDLATVITTHDVPLVAITDSAKSPLVPLAREWLMVAEDDHAGFRSLAAGITLASALPVAVAERRRLGIGQGSG